MQRQGQVFCKDIYAGKIWQDEEGFHFQYDSQYLNRLNAKAISFTLPLQEKSFDSLVMFSFFDGLIPEGWLLNIATNTWKINQRDRMLLLFTLCEDCIGDVSIKPIKGGEDE